MLSYKVFLQRFISDDFYVNCSFCDHQTADLSHLFWYCDYKNLWGTLKHIECFLFGISLEISLKYENVILGYTHESEVRCFWFIRFLAKYVIHKCKFCKRKLFYKNFLEDLKLYMCFISDSTNKKAVKTVNLLKRYIIFLLPVTVILLLHRFINKK